VFGSVILEFGSQDVIVNVYQLTHFEVLAFNFLAGVSLSNSSPSAFRFLLDLRRQVMGTLNVSSHFFCHNGRALG
jgi:hypothetical protein